MTSRFQFIEDWFPLEHECKHKHKHKKNKTVCCSCAYAYVYVEHVTSENSTRQISGFILMLLLMLDFMSWLFSLVLILMHEPMLML